jgi:peroxiredoxin
MRTLALIALLSISTGACATFAETEAEANVSATVGQKAPDFELKDLDGKTVKLSSFSGKTVVIEWFNPGCPYVVAAYESGPLKDMAKKAGEQGVVWLAINSGAPGKEGHGLKANKDAAAKWAISHPILVDEGGKVGKAYGAKTTPHIYVVDPKGTLAYAGSLDNAPRGEVPPAGYRGYVAEAIEATRTGQPVKAAQTQPWGCSVKY